MTLDPWHLLGVDTALTAGVVSQAVVGEAIYRLSHAVWHLRTKKTGNKGRRRPARERESRPPWYTAFEFLDGCLGAVAVAAVIVFMLSQQPWVLCLIIPIWIFFRALNLSWSALDQENLIESQHNELGHAMAYSYWMGFLKDFKDADFDSLEKSDYKKVLLIPKKASMIIDEIPGQRVITAALEVKPSDHRAHEQRANIKFKLVEITSGGETMKVIYDCPRVIKSTLGKTSRMSSEELRRRNLRNFYTKLKHLLTRYKPKFRVPVDIIVFDDSAPGFSLSNKIFEYYRRKLDGELSEVISSSGDDE